MAEEKKELWLENIYFCHFPYFFLTRKTNHKTLLRTKIDAKLHIRNVLYLSSFQTVYCVHICVSFAQYVCISECMKVYVYVQCKQVKAMKVNVEVPVMEVGRGVAE